MTGVRYLMAMPGRLDGGGEAVARRLRRHDRHRRLAVAAVHGVEQVGLLGLGGQAGRGTAALHVDDDQRQLQVDGQADGLGLEVEAGAAGRRHPERAAEGRAQGGADAGDLVLGLEGADAELLAPAELVEDVRRRRDRIAAQEDVHTGQPGGGDQPPGQGLVAGDLDVLALLEGGRLDLVVGLEQLGRLAEVVAGPEGPGVGVGHLRPGAETLRRSTRSSARPAGCTAS